MTVDIYVGDCRDVLAKLPAESVHCCVTSPPYWGLRDYGVDGQLGHEKTPDEYVTNLVEIFRQVRRVLRDDGTLWLNLGDTYASANACDRRSVIGQGSPDETCQRPNRLSGILKEKDLIGIPWRVALALQADGWWLRSDIIWSKPNCMPESVTDRPTKSHEYVFLLSKSAQYFYDADAIREPLSSDPATWGRHSNKDPGLQALDPRPMFGPGRNGRDGTEWGDGISRNRRTVWTIPTHPFPGAHFATFPPALVEPCIKAGTSKRGCCPECGAPWERVTEREPKPKGRSSPDRYMAAAYNNSPQSKAWGHKSDLGGDPRPVYTIDWRPTCTHDAAPVLCTVLDPFAGAGTTGLVADRLGRDAILIELNPDYAKMSERRIKDEAPMFVDIQRVQERQ